MFAAACALAFVVVVVIGAVLLPDAGGGQSASISARLSALPSRPALGAPASTRSPPGNGAIVAILHSATVMRARPGGRRLAAVSLRTSFGSPTVLLVRRRKPGWLGVVSVLAGNNRLGWIPSSSANLTRVPYRIEVFLGRRRLEVLRDGRVLQRYTVAVGMPSAPTPTGTFAVTDRLLTHDPTGPYGCCILALSAVAPHAIQGWTGGNRIAIHSTPETSSIGHAVSHGCVRLTLPEGRWLVDHIPLGTPVVISSA
jgi:lipoprotein-anchoring transpeptidase ErfK/SrfK